MAEIATVTIDKNICSISGALTYQTVTRVLAKLQNADVGESNLILDLEEITHCDSAALALLLELRIQSGKRHCELNIHNAPAQLQALAAAHELSTLLI